MAGKRAGLKHADTGDNETTRSGLFMEAVRIIEEMRNVTNGEYPKYAVWENVPGAFSSNKGEDFRTVLEELIKIVEPAAVMPPVPAKGWAYADSFSGDGWSLAWRVFDAQYWGVPQRRRRIYLVLDLTGQRARKILFEREGLRGYFAEGRSPWENLAGDVERGVGADDREGERNCLTPWDVQSRRIFTSDGAWPALYGGEGGGHGYAMIPHTLKNRSGCEGNFVGFDAYQHHGWRQSEVSGTLTADNCGHVKGDTSLIAQPIAVDQGGGKSGANYHHDLSPTLTCTHGGEPVVAYGVTTKGNGDAFISKERHTAVSCGGGQAGQGYPCVMERQMYENHSQDTRYKGPLEVAQTISATYGMGGNNQPFVVEQIPFCKSSRGKFKGDAETWKDATVANTLNTFDQGEARANELVVAPIHSPQGKTIGRHAGCYAIGNGQADNTGLHKIPGALNCMHDQQAVLLGDSSHYIVRRLTPTECARLQGFADDWGVPSCKEDLTEDEYHFWLNVRNTHAAVNGRATKDYTKKQMLAWYNKLHSDSAEYKMWGNGIALPCALYVMQGIAEALTERRKAG